MPRLALSLLLGLGTLGGAGAVSATPDAFAVREARAWAAARAQQPAVAAQLFAELQAAAPDAIAEQPSIAFGRATTLLNAEPRTAARVAEAEALLARLARESPTLDWQLLARFFLARTAQLHRHPPAPAEALALYRDLVTEHPSHPVAQLAIPKIAALLLYFGDEPAPALRAQLAQLETHLSLPAARRDFHLLVANATLLRDWGDADALRHLLAADAAGILQTKRVAEVSLQIAETARRVGQNALAATYYQRFLDAFPDDPRAQLVEERLAVVTAEIAATPTTP